MTEHLKIPVGVSQCLLGDAIRYDGKDKRNTCITDTLSQYFEFIPFCPEINIGLGVPRDPIHLVNANGQIRCQDILHPEQDVTAALEEAARHYAKHNPYICGFIFTQNSPSCGVNNVKVWNQSTYEQTGRGIFARQLITLIPALPVIEDQQLSDLTLREAFIVEVNHYFKNTFI